MYPIYIKDVINVLDIVTLNFLQKKKKKNVTLNKGLKKKIQHSLYSSSAWHILDVTTNVIMPIDKLEDKWVLVNSTGKVSNGWIRNLKFNSYLHQKLIGILFWYWLKLSKKNDKLEDNYVFFFIYNYYRNFFYINGWECTCE